MRLYQHLAENKQEDKLLLRR